MYPNLAAHINRFVHINEDEATQLAHFIQPIQVKKKSFVLKEGQVCKADYFVEKGCLRMYFVNEKGIEQITQFALEHWWIADYFSMLNQKETPFNIQAIEDSEILCMELKNQSALFKQLPQMETYCRIMAQKAYAASQMRTKFFHDFSKEESYRHFNNLFPEFVQRVPQYMLASYLGLTPEYLSEIRKKK
jgi:CRP-like cAMP-binding protein